MKIQEIYKRKRPVLSFEIFPPKKESALKNIDETLRILCELKPDFISVTFGASGNQESINKTLALAKKIKYEYQVEPLVHLTCLHYTKEQIDAFTKLLHENGIENVLALRGDRNDTIPEQHDFQYASALSEYLKEHTDFCVGGACYPECHPESKDAVKDIHNLKEKVVAGDAFLISQLFFDNKMFYSFIERCQLANITVPVSAGIMPVVNKKQIEKMVTLCGATLPARFQKILETFAFDEAALFDAGMSYAISQIIDLLATGVDGIHLYTMNNPVIARRICEGIKNIMKEHG